ncbi:hypothetical protein lbkm_3672 [Lachnospiraceae bacterium KM106-2]|nr:hypothetical protein lbkm_3672 [Lachnospiraceae bacterium KM106-2]
MSRKVIKYSMAGISWGCTVFCIVNMIGAMLLGDSFVLESGHSYPAQVLTSMLVGIAWVVPTLVYESEKISRGIQILIHLTIGFCVYIPCGIYMGWIPCSFGIGTMLTTILGMVIISILIWLCFSLYYRKEARMINNKIK